jgi:hypothetical protein
MCVIKFLVVHHQERGKNLDIPAKMEHLSALKCVLIRDCLNLGGKVPRRKMTRGEKVSK